MGLLKYLLLLIVISLAPSHALANEGEGLDYMSSAVQMKNQEIDSQLQQTLIENCQAAAEQAAAEQAQQNPQDGESAEVARNNALNECFQENLDNRSQEDLEEISKVLNLRGFDLIKRNSPECVQSYLKERMCRIMKSEAECAREQCDPRCDPSCNQMPLDISDRTYISHHTYAQLYESKLGRNILAELSTYCLKHIEVTEGCFDREKGQAPDPKELPKSLQKCMIPRNLERSQLKEASDREMAIGSRSGGDYLNAKFKACSISINDICEKKDESESFFANYTGTASAEAAERSACIIRNNHRIYKKAVKKLTDTKEKLARTKTREGFQMGVTYGRVFHGSGESTVTPQADIIVRDEHGQLDTRTQVVQVAEDSVDDATILTSKDAREIIGGEEEKERRLQEFDSKCNPDSLGEQSQECKEELHSYDEKVVERLEMKKQLGLEAINKLQEEFGGDSFNPDDEDHPIYKFLVQNGMDKEIRELEETGDINAVLDKVKVKFEKEKQSIIEDINNQIGQKEMLQEINLDDESSTANNSEQEGSDPNDFNRAVSRRRNQIENEAEAQEAIYQYTNVVSSYLETQEDGQAAGSNSISMDRELSSLQEGNRPEDEQQVELLGNLQNEREPSNNTNRSDGASSVSESFIDIILGNPNEDEEDDS